MALHTQLRAITERYGVQVLDDANGLGQALAANPEAGQWAEADVDRIVETVRSGGLPRLTAAVNSGMDPSSAIAATGETIARERESSDVDGIRWALAVLAFAAGRLPETDVHRWSPPSPGYRPVSGYGAGPGQEGWAGPGYEYAPLPEPSSSRTPILIGVAVVVVLALLGVGGWWLLSQDDGFDEQAYCDAYQATDESFSATDFAQLDAQAFEDLQRQVDEISDLAPPEMRDEWETLADALDEFESILAEAGLTFDDLPGLVRGEVPEGVDPADLQVLASRMQEFVQSTELESAGDAVDEDAETRCN